MTNTIKNENGQFRSATGLIAVRAFGLKILASALQLEISCPGLKASRVSALKHAKAVTGLKTNDRAAQREAVLKLMNEAIAQCKVVTK